MKRTWRQAELESRQGSNFGRRQGTAVEANLINGSIEEVRLCTVVGGESFIILTGIVQINIRRIAKYLLELRRSKPKPTYDRRRDTEGLSDYVRTDRSADEGAELKVPDPPPLA